jgi:hypothetical protein
LVRRNQLSPSKARIFFGDHIIDVHQGPERAYYAVSKSGSNEILALGDAASAEEAEATARWTIVNLTGREGKVSAPPEAAAEAKAS